MQYRRWTEAEDRYICMNACMHTDRTIALNLSRISGVVVTAHAVKHRRHTLKVLKRPEKPQ